MSRVRREQRRIVRFMVEEVVRYGEDECDDDMKCGTCAILGGKLGG